LICKIKDEKSNYLGELYSNCAKHTLELNKIYRSRLHIVMA